MYYYLFEAQRGPKEYERAAQIKELLANLGIAGEMATPTPGKSVEDLVAGAIAKRYSTIIAVGGIELANRTAHALGQYDAVFGIIPTAEHPDLARLIGTTDWKMAAEQLKRRRWRTVRMGRLNESTYFILPAHIEFSPDVSYTVSGPDYVLSGTGGEMTVTANAQLELVIGQAEPPKRGLLKSLFSKQAAAPSQTNLFLEEFELTSSFETSVRVAGVPIAATPVRFSLETKELKLIVGKGGAE